MVQKSNSDVRSLDAMTVTVLLDLYDFVSVHSSINYDDWNWVGP